MRQQQLIPVPGLTRVGLDDARTFALYLDCGIWRASCPGCGFELAEGRHQDWSSARRPAGPARSAWTSPDTDPAPRDD